jgi:hypothetical protein
MKPKKDTGKKPFFARFLEKQELERVQGGRPPFHTLKYPSDEEEDGTNI